jgi:circadian clock protein KaiB
MKKTSRKKTPRKKTAVKARNLDIKATPLKSAKLKLGRYILKLYITGTTPQSQKALANIKRICEEHLKGKFDLRVIDIYQNPTLAKNEQIIAAPTLIRVLPLPLRRFIGDLSNEEKVLLGLDIHPERSRKSS